MKSLSEMLGTALAALLLGSSALYAGDGTWVSVGGETIDVRGGHRMAVISDEGSEAFDVSELRDGETRTFGEGAKQVTVQRHGDVVTVARAGEGEDKPVEVQCDLPEDNCKILTFADEPQKVMVVIGKQRECIKGSRDCDLMIDGVEHLNAAGATIHAIVHQVDCDRPGDCAQIEKVIGHGPDALGNVMIFRAGGPAGDPQVLLTCPEGDATLRVAADEADDSYLCPKHSVPMQKAGKAL